MIQPRTPVPPMAPVRLPAPPYLESTGESLLDLDIIAVAPSEPETPESGHLHPSTVPAEAQPQPSAPEAPDSSPPEASRALRFGGVRLTPEEHAARVKHNEAAKASIRTEYVYGLPGPRPEDPRVYPSLDQLADKYHVNPRKVVRWSTKDQWLSLRNKEKERMEQARAASAQADLAAKATTIEKSAQAALSAANGEMLQMVRSWQLTREALIAEAVEKGKDPGRIVYSAPPAQIKIFLEIIDRIEKLKRLFEPDPAIAAAAASGVSPVDALVSERLLALPADEYARTMRAVFGDEEPVVHPPVQLPAETTTGSPQPVAESTTGSNPGSVGDILLWEGTGL